MGCEIPCEALKRLLKIIKETENKNKTEMVKKYKDDLDMVYAEPDPEVEERAEMILKEYADDLEVVDNFDVTIGYVKSLEPKTKNGKLVFADCRKVNEVFKAFLPFDFIITLYERNIIMLDENQIDILIYHELKHIGIGAKGLKVVEHDIEDFDSIVSKFGLHWDDNDDTKKVLNN